ncbi:MAG TPA: TonB-dependent receptor [Xanthomonadales bacterium]|nr:TonB-dependent receptor [Xanthomonadales bacterium]
MLEEVLVTAQRREQNLMEVPVSLTVFSGDALEKLGAPDLAYLSQFSPNTTLEPTPGTNNTLTAWIRGVGQQDINAGFETGVSVYLDDVYLNRPQAAILDIYDVERIEILRGPQGTLYGRNSVGGAIRYITRPLPDQPYMNTRLSYGSYNQREWVLTAAMPVAESLKLGGSLAWFQRDGFGQNLYLGTDNYSKDVFASRFSAEWAGSENFTLRLAADYLDDNSGTRFGHRLQPGQLSGAPVLDDVFNTRGGLDNPQPGVTAKGVSLTANWVIRDGLQLKNVLALRSDETWAAWDFDSLPAADFDLPLFFRNRQFTEELHLLMSGKDWNGLLGVFYIDANAFQNYDVLLANTGAIIGLPGLNAFTEGDVDTRSRAVFADFSWRFSGHWSVDFGLRHTVDERRTSVLRETLVGGTSERFGGNPRHINTTSDFYGEAEFNRVSPRVVLDWTPSEGHLVYSSYSEGFKGGGFDPRGQTSLAPDLDNDGVVAYDEVYEFMSFTPEVVVAWELGYKAVLWGGRMNSRLAAFWADYSDIQIPGSLAVDTDGDGIDDQFVGTTTNAASADINGVEWEGQALLAQDWMRSGDAVRWNWAVGYLHTDFNEFIDDSGEDVADIYQFRNSPEWTLSGLLAYELASRWFRQDGNLLVFTSLAYRSETVQFEYPSPELDQPAFTLWDLGVVWTRHDQRWQLGLHGKNLTDEEYITAGFYAPTLGRERNITAFYGNPRQVWATLQYQMD